MSNASFYVVNDSKNTNTRQLNNSISLADISRVQLETPEAFGVIEKSMASNSMHQEKPMDRAVIEQNIYEQNPKHASNLSTLTAGTGTGIAVGG